MIDLTMLTSSELHLLDVALTALDEALVLCEDAGSINAEDGVDVVELNDAVGAELERRGLEDAEYNVDRALKRGECVPVVRPDGQIGYVPSE